MKYDAVFPNIFFTKNVVAQNLGLLYLLIINLEFTKLK